MLDVDIADLSVQVSRLRKVSRKGLEKPLSALRSDLEKQQAATVTATTGGAL